MNRPVDYPPEWKAPLPEKLARPTYWPAMLALGVTIMLMGPITITLVSVAGLALVAAALIGWAGEIARG